MNGFEATRLRKLEIFEGRFNELMDFNAYCKSIEGRRFTSYLLVMAPLEAKFNVRPVNEKDQKIKLYCGGASDHSLISEMIKIAAANIGVYAVSFNPEKEQLKVVGQVDPVEIARKLRQKHNQVEILSVNTTKSKLPFLFPKKHVILSGCQVRREDPVVLPADLRFLRIFECHNMRSLSDISLFFQQTNELRLCSIQDCRGIESVLDLSLSSSSCNALQNLEHLWIERLDNLRVLIKVGEASAISTSSSLPLPGIFSHLKSFLIKGCSNMKQLFPFELRHDLQNLEKLVVRYCGQLEEIIGSEEDEESHKGKGTNSPTTFTLPKLKKLELKNLPALKNICGSNRAMICNSLKKIEVWECPNLKRMPLYLPVFQDTNQPGPSAHPFERIRIYPKEWWNSVEWDYPNAKNVLLPWLVMV